MFRSTVLALCAATALAGCNSTAPLSRSDLVARGDAVCKRVNDGIKSVGATNSAADVARVAPKVHAVEQQGLDDLRKLKPPDSLASQWSTFLDKVQVLTNDVSKIGAAAKTNDAKAAQAVAAEASSASAVVRGIATRLGFTQCSRQN